MALIRAITRLFYYLYVKVLLTTTTGCKTLGVYHKLHVVLINSAGIKESSLMMTPIRRNM
jgi:hypothetical protein